MTAADGVYVRYPFHAMLRTLGAVSQARHTIVIGEDLGVVPPGFREVMQKTEIQSYRVFFFEKRDDILPAAGQLSARGARLPHHPRPSHARRLVERARHRRRATQIGMIERRRPAVRQREERAHGAGALLGLLADEGAAARRAWRR